jgi:nucleoid-associated protein YgaU
VRLKIKGEITREQLVKAFEMATEALEGDVPGAKFYGANLYLVPYHPDGERLKALDEHGSAGFLTVPAQPGTNMRPALSAEAQQRRDAAREAKRQRENQVAERDRQELAEYNRKRQIQAVQIAKARIAFSALNELTSKLLASEPQVLVDGFNEAIRVSWHSHAPKEPHGPRKGELKPLPEFSIVDGKLSLYAASWKSPRLLLNPIGSLNSNLIAPVWTHDAWLVSVGSFLKIMREVGGTLPEDIFGDHLPKGIAAH